VLYGNGHKKGLKTATYFNLQGPEENDVIFTLSFVSLFLEAED
jgi:hypothetical protein